MTIYGNYNKSFEHEFRRIYIPVINQPPLMEGKAVGHNPAKFGLIWFRGDFNVIFLSKHS